MSATAASTRKRLIVLLPWKLKAGNLLKSRGSRLRSVATERRCSEGDFCRECRRLSGLCVEADIARACLGDPGVSDEGVVVNLDRAAGEPVEADLDAQLLVGAN